MKDFEREQWAFKRARLVRVAADEPDLPCALLAERFGVSDSVVRRVLSEEGIRRSEDGFAKMGRRA